MATKPTFKKPLFRNTYAIFFFAYCCFSSAALAHESEMTRLMRHMLQYIKTEKQQLALGKKTQRFPKKFVQINTAKVTEGKKLAEHHAAFIGVMDKK